MRKRDAPVRKTWPGVCARSVTTLSAVPLRLKRISALVQVPLAIVTVSPGRACLIEVLSWARLVAKRSAARPPLVAARTATSQPNRGPARVPVPRGSVSYLSSFILLSVHRWQAVVHWGNRLRSAGDPLHLPTGIRYLQPLRSGDATVCGKPEVASDSTFLDPTVLMAST